MLPPQRQLLARRKAREMEAEMGGGAPIKGLPEMSASEANKLSQKHVTDNSAPIIKAIYEKIREACTKGKFSIRSPFYNIQGVAYMSEAERQAVTSYFKSRGYSFVDYDDPDPGNPVSCGGYTSLEW